MKMPENIDTIMFAPCGMNCLVCYVHLKKKKPCSGCLSDDTNKPERCKTCVLKMCAREKGITFCFDCKEFPCKKIMNLEKSYQRKYQASLVTNSRIVCENGLEQFFYNEKLRWSCPECQGIISLHDKECSECNKEM
jgi:hypothetical protein